jgi:hypothetical protein
LPRNWEVLKIPDFSSMFDSALTVMQYVAFLLLSFFRAGGIKEAKGVEVCRPRTCDVYSYVASNIDSSHSFIFSSLAPVQSPEAMSNEPEKQIDESSEMEDTPVWYVDHQAFDPSQFDGLVPHHAHLSGCLRPLDVCRKKYSEYSVKVDPNQDDKSTEIRICNFKRPHMRYVPDAGLSCGAIHNSLTLLVVRSLLFE